MDMMVAPVTAAALSTGASLTLDRLARVYPDGTRAVDDVSFSVTPGRFLTLLGPSGSGKTTTLKMIAGFEAPDAGVITLAGRDISRVPAHARDIGMVFQNYALFPHMTVADNIGFPLRMRRRPTREIRAAVEEVLALLHLDQLGGRFPRQLSGGQQQRVALARAIVFRPPLLLMDEPLGALDRQLRKEVQSELKRLQRQLGLTTVYVTHDQDEALFLSDEIAIMQAGRVVQQGAPETLYAQPAMRFVASFLGESNFLPGTVAAVADGQVWVTLAGGVIVRGRAVGALVPGMRAEILMRPEKIDLHAAGTVAAPDANLLPGRVEMVNFLGSAQEYELDVAGSRLAARLFLRAAVLPFGIGDAVTLQVAPGDCLVFPAP
jgi:spermidine/putrescine ABC transporter ATP-binding subunit